MYWLADYCDLCGEFAQVTLQEVEDDTFFMCENCLEHKEEIVTELKSPVEFRWEEV